jgi:hypothetical protein
MPGPGGPAAGKRGGLSGFFLWSMVRRVGPGLHGFPALRLEEAVSPPPGHP